jgi:NAD(P)H-flavin reductase
MKKILKLMSCLFQIYFANSWGIDYQNIYGCTKPTLSQSMMGGKTTIKNNEITFVAKNMNKDIINTFTDINTELLLEFSSINMQGILIDVTHGSLLLNNIIINEYNTKFACDNKRLFTRSRSKTWIYKWLPGEYTDLEITFMYAPAYVPVILSYFKLPFNCPSCGPTSTYPPYETTTQNTPQYTSYDKKYTLIKYKSITFGWYIFENKISIISSIKVEGCFKWFSIAFTKEYDMMIGSDAIFGWGNELCQLNIDAYYLPAESKDIGKSIYNYKKPNEYLLSKNIRVENNIMTIEFTRLLNTGNFSDIQINLKNNITNIIYAIGDEMAENIVSMHTEDETFYVNFLEGFLPDNTNTEIKKYYIFFISIIGAFVLSLFSIFIIHYKIFYNTMKFFNKNIKLKFLGFISIGNIIFITTYFIWWLLVCFYCFISNEKNEIVKRLGYWISTNLSATLLPISRNNLSVILFKISPEKIIYTHIFIGFLFMFSVLIKLIACIIIYKSDIFMLTYYSDTNPLMGLLSTICVIVISFISVPYIRKNFYEIFYYSHRILSFFIILFSSLHSTVTFYYILPSLLLYIADILTRIYKLRQIVYANFKNINEEENNFTMINIISKKDIKVYPSCYFLVCYTKISSLQWHALSLISYDNKNLLFCIKNMGNNTWSGKLFDYISTISDNRDVNKDILIQGPYGYLPIEYKNYKSIIIIAGGIGITPMFSILDDIHANFQPFLTKVSFIWIVNNSPLLRYFKKMLLKYNYNTLFDIQIYVTKHIVCDIYTDLKVTFEKPVISNLLVSSIKGLYKDNAVICCGPESLTDDIKLFCSINNMDVFCDSFKK